MSKPLTLTELRKLYERSEQPGFQFFQERLIISLPTLLAAARRVEELEFELTDIHECYRKVLADEGASDEGHCACVPHLRRRIAELEANNNPISTQK